MASSRTDPRPPDRSSTEAPARDSAADIGEGVTEEILLRFLQEAMRLSVDHKQRTVESGATRSYKAWNNQHADGSKYNLPGYRGRSRLFVPKTRSAVRKNLTAAANALFATEDVVSITAELEDDPLQAATASVIGSLVEYRTSRQAGRSGMPWFLICMGGNLDAQLTGVTVSKQHWNYDEVETSETEIVIDPESGKEIEQLKMRVERDRPMSTLIPLENVHPDPAAPWYDVVQAGAFWSVVYPMRLGEARTMMQAEAKRGSPVVWHHVDDSTLRMGRGDLNQSATRRARERGGDRYEETKGSGDLDIVWLYENFIRIDGRDWHFWSVGTNSIITNISETRDIYPAFDGDRPYTFGVGQIDSHKVFPMSPVESWQPLQFEINDIVNLRLDTLKRSIAPLAKVKRGRNVDMVQLQRRGNPDAVLLLDSVDDVEFEATPGPSGASYTETSAANAAFDELSGSFSTASVQTSRQLNETVGGMRLMSGASNAVTEFDLRIWVETWCEPTLRQIAHLVRYYESSEKALRIAGAKAQVWEKHRYMPGFDDFDSCDLMLRVNVGIGATDPMQKMGKFKAAIEMLLPMQEMFEAQGITPKGDVIIEEVMGSAGYRDGKRFFEFGEPAEPQQDPAILKAMQDLQVQMEKIAASREKTQMDNETKMQIEQMRQQTAVLSTAVNARAQGQKLRQQREEAGMARFQQMFGAAAPAKREGGAQEQETPLASAVLGRLDQMEQVTRRNADLMGQVAQSLLHVTNMLDAVARHQAAPTQIEWQDGKVAAVIKGGLRQAVHRRPDGRADGLAPAPQPQLGG